LTLSLGLISDLTAVFGGTLWPSSPEIHPRENLKGTTFRLPFTIKNMSAIPIGSVDMTCGIDWVYFHDQHDQKFNFQQLAFVNDTLSIDPGQTVNYECDASHFIKVNNDGSWEIRGIKLQGPFWVYPPLDFRKMCLWIRGDYKLFGFIPWGFTSIMFQWPSGPGVYQWTEGPLHNTGQITQDEWLDRRQKDNNLPPSVVRCSDEPHKTALLFDKEGKPTLRPGLVAK
jgi:hypothetical protein